MTGPRLKAKSPTNSTLILGWSQQTASRLNEQIEGCYVEDIGLPPRPPPPPPPGMPKQKRKKMKKKHIPQELVDISRRWKAFRQNNRRKLALALEEEKKRRQELIKLNEAAIVEYGGNGGSTEDCEILFPQILYRDQQEQQKSSNKNNSSKKSKGGKKEKNSSALSMFTKKQDRQRIVSHVKVNEGNSNDPAASDDELAIDVMKKTMVNDDDDTEATSTCSSLVGEGIEDWSLSSSSDHSAITRQVNNTCRYRMEQEFLGTGEVYVDPWTAAKRGNMQVLEKFVNHFPNYDWTRHDKCGYTPLHYACQYGAKHDLMVVAFLLLEWIKNEGQMPPKFVLKRCKRNAVNEFVIKILERPYDTRKILAEWELVQPFHRYLFERLGIINEEPEEPPFYHDSSDYREYDTTIDDDDNEREKGEVETEIFKRIVPITKKRRPISSSRRPLRAQ